MQLLLERTDTTGRFVGKVFVFQVAKSEDLPVYSIHSYVFEEEHRVIPQVMNAR
jgi:DNA-binding transcriptional regulator of glucitol operon